MKEASERLFVICFFQSEVNITTSLVSLKYILTSAETETELLNSFNRPKARYREEELGLRLSRGCFYEPINKRLKCPLLSFYFNPGVEN